MLLNVQLISQYHRVNVFRRAYTRKIAVFFTATDENTDFLNKIRWAEVYMQFFNYTGVSVRRILRFLKKKAATLRGNFLDHSPLETYLLKSSYCCYVFKHRYHPNTFHNKARKNNIFFWGCVHIFWPASKLKCSGLFSFVWCATNKLRKNKEARWESLKETTGRIDRLAA